MIPYPTVNMADRQDSPDLVFVHLSDIHFRMGEAGDLHDEGVDLRNELQLDLRRLRARFPRLDGLVISGDIAFGGQSAEYAYARGWIESVRELLGCDRTGVMLTPGNHDVDRSLIPPGGEVDELQRAIRNGPSAHQRDRLMAGILRHETRGEALLKPVQAYNDLAKEYECEVSRTSPFWERDFDLSDGTKLRFRGMTSTMLSGPNDDESTHKMLYGAAQRQILRLPNVRYAVIGHHPPSWTLEGDDADRAFSDRTAFQLFGHKHDQWVTVLGSGVRLIAGAVHPDPAEAGWLPRYAAIAVSVVGDEQIALRVYPRRWSDEETTFIPDFNSAGRDFRDFTVRVEPRTAATSPEPRVAATRSRPGRRHDGHDAQ